MLHKDIKNSASNSTSSGTDDSEGEVVTKSTIGLCLMIKELILFDDYPLKPFLSELIIWSSKWKISIWVPFDM